MKKLAFVLLSLLLVAGVSLGAQSVQYGQVAVGPVYSLNVQGVTSPLNGLGITGKIPNLPPVIGLNFSFGSGNNFLGVTSDWIMYNQPLYAPWNINFFMGPGFYSSINIAPNFGAGSYFNLGLRIPFGVNFVPVKFLELFVDFAPAFGITFKDPIAPAWLFQAEAGGRVWF